MSPKTQTDTNPPEADEQPKTEKPKAVRKKAANLNTDGSKRIIKKGVKRTHRKKTVELLTQRVQEYQHRLDKHASEMERLKKIQDKYVQEIEWKKLESGATTEPGAGFTAEATVEPACEVKGA